VDHAVVSPAEEDEVPQGGGPAECPGDQVVGITPPGRASASGGLAAAVSEFEGSADCGWDDPGSTSDVEDLGGALGDDAADRGVAGQPACGFSGDGAGVGEFGLSETSLQHFEIDQNGEMGAFPTGGGEITMVEVVAADVDQGVGPRLGGGSPVVVVDECGVGVGGEGSEDDLAAFGIELAVEPHHAAEGGRDVEESVFGQLLLVLFPSVGVGGLFPVLDHMTELRCRDRGGGVDQIDFSLANASGFSA